MAKHEFALYYEKTEALCAQSQALIADATLVHRIHTVLRLQPNDYFIVFNAHYHARCKIIEKEKRSIFIYVEMREQNKKLYPEIIWYLPLLEREAFDRSVSLLTVMGISRIVPLITGKSRKKWGTEKDRERIKRVMIAAAEQSKQFSLPVIDEVTDISSVSFGASSDVSYIWFDPTGKPASSVISLLQAQGPSCIYCMVGPEGDFTHDEKKMLENISVTKCALTPTVLRAVDAVAVSSGMLRSLL